MPRLRPPIALLAASILLLAGCSTTTRVAADGTLRVALTEYHVQPQSVRAASGTLTIVVRNNGRLSHNLVISLDGRPQASTKPIAPGQTAELFASLAPGRYTMSSTILSDQALGAYGTLTVTR
ncbi:MAG TPA: cupredoxin domain-containing protein [Solirubrobacteraceae bacterium]